MIIRSSASLSDCRNHVIFGLTCFLMFELQLYQPKRVSSKLPNYYTIFKLQLFNKHIVPVTVFVNVRLRSSSNSSNIVVEPTRRTLKQLNTKIPRKSFLEKQQWSVTAAVRAWAFFKHKTDQAFHPLNTDKLVPVAAEVEGRCNAGVGQLAADGAHYQLSAIN